MFHSRWWLEAATGGDYQEAEVRAGGRTVARFPYVIERKFAGHKLCTMPELTHFLGPAIDAGPSNAVNRTLKRFHITQELLAQLSAFSGFYHKLHAGISDTLAFEEARYTTFVQFTYEILPQPERAIWDGMRDKTRNVIRRAEERWRVETLDDPHAFAALYEANLRRRGMVNYYTRVRAVGAEALARGHGRILAVKDARGAVLGAIFVVWDQRVCYYLLATRSRESDNGVMSLLVWNAICDAAARGLVFDFDGVGTPGSRLFFTGFGGRITPRYIVARHSLRYRVAGQVTKLLNRGAAFGRHAASAA
ncbi:MAG: GNAT family N-acetyltransferase [Acetobacteraceae bacterium]